ncbi:Enoyl-CoA hydratase ACTT3 [Fusarium oxysporum f. sp. albedinis]|nr:Enoyl-CoA hydratase ACTT3 [Fusarium oxysporum f. sp. albedinis]
MSPELPMQPKHIPLYTFNKTKSSLSLPSGINVTSIPTTSHFALSRSRGCQATISSTTTIRYTAHQSTGTNLDSNYNRRHLFTASLLALKLHA